MKTLCPRPCPLCHAGTMRPGETTYMTAEPAIIALEHVPALICDLCSNEAFGSGVLDAIDDVVTGRTTPLGGRSATATVYDFARVQAPAGR